MYYNVWQSTDSSRLRAQRRREGGWQIEMMIYFGSNAVDGRRTADDDKRKHSPSLSTWTRSAFKFKSYRPTLAGDQRQSERQTGRRADLNDPEQAPNRPQQCERVATPKI